MWPGQPAVEELLLQQVEQQQPECLHCCLDDWQLEVDARPP